MKRNRVRMGPGPIDTYPLTAFVQIPSKELEAAWAIVGPTVDWNIDRGSLWKQFAAVYIEGLNHGHAIAQERVENRGF